MPHRRALVRAAVVAALEAAPEVQLLAGAPPVESSRALPLDSASLPRILVYMRGEAAGNRLITESPREYLAQADLVVEYVARSPPLSAAAEDELDVAAEAIESVLDRLESTLVEQGLARDVRYVSTEVAVSIDGRQRSQQIVIRYQVDLQKQVIPPALDDFLTAESVYDLGDDAADPTSDELDLPQ